MAEGAKNSFQNEATAAFGKTGLGTAGAGLEER